MKKLCSLLVAGAFMLGGVFMSKAEALTHYHYNGAAGKEKVLLFTKAFAKDQGYVMSIQPKGSKRKLAYLGKWHSQLEGCLVIKYEVLRVLEADNKVVKERPVAIEMKLLKKKRSVQVVTPDNSYGNIYDMHEYVWGNDPNMAAYILKKTLNQFGAKTEVTPIAPSLEKLNQEALAIVNRASQGAEGEGFWFRAKDAAGHTVGTYYVETDPVAIYLRDGSYLGWLDGEMFPQTSGF